MNCASSYPLVEDLRQDDGRCCALAAVSCRYHTSVTDRQVPLMAAGSEPLVVFWSGRGIHITVLLSFVVQVTLLLLADIRRRTDWPVIKVIIWSAYMLADTTAIYALGHLSVVVRSPEHHLMALWAPLLLVHLGGQDHITAYAIEDNRLWLRHLQIFGVQLVATGYVLYASSILSSTSLLCPPTILMFVVGVLKYGERVWALMGADKSASSSLSATSYKDFGAEQAKYGGRGHATKTDEVDLEDLSAEMDMEAHVFVIAYSLLDVPKQMFEGPTRFVKIKKVRCYEGSFMLEVVEIQLTMMYDLLYTKAAVVHTWYGFFIRVISLPFTIAAPQMFRALGEKDGYTRSDVVVTKVLLSGAVVLETMSVYRAVFSMWTAGLLYEWKWYKLGRFVQQIELSFVSGPMMILALRKGYWSGHMRQHDLFHVSHHTNYSTGSKIAKRMGREDLWDSTFYSWSTQVPTEIIDKVLELVSATSARQINITESRGRNALRRHSLSLGKDLAWSMGLDLDESILVWHIATRVYLKWYSITQATPRTRATRARDDRVSVWEHYPGTDALCNHMFFLLAARPHMLPYPITRQRYVQLCHDSITHLSRCRTRGLLKAILKQKEALIEGSPLILDGSSISRRTDPLSGNSTRGGPARPSINTTLDKGCRLAAKLLHIAEGADAAERGTDAVGILEMIFEVWVEMLCYTAYWCNEKSHAKNLTNGGELMTIVASMMVYTSNGFIKKTKKKKKSGAVFL